MLAELKLSAIAVAFVAAFALPYGIFYIAPLVFSVVTGQRSGDISIVVVLLWALCSLLAPIAGGYLAARLSQVQPLLHGALTGLLASVVAALMVSSLRTALLTFLVFIPGGICGAWLWRHFSTRVSP